MKLPAWVMKPLRHPRVIRFVDRVFMRLQPAPGGEAHVLVAPPGRGNIGDQALVEAFVETVEGHVIVAVRSTRDIAVAPRFAGRMQLIELPALVYGSAMGRARDLRRLAAAASDATTFSIVGADIMDGAYVPRASVNRALLARRFAELGWNTRVLGFSWNASPHPVALDQLRRAARAGALLCVRDPLSAERARRDGLEVTETADIVFVAKGGDSLALARVWPTLVDSDRLALVNASGLVEAGIEPYVATIQTLRSSGMKVLIVPHVSRPGADDLPFCDELAARFSNDEGVRALRALLTPPEIRGLGARASIAVTGRMHLAVMSTMSGTPALTLATQGKVEGLMNLLGTPQLCLEPGPGLEQRLPEAVSMLIENEPELRGAILAALPTVTSLASKNFDGMLPAGARVTSSDGAHGAAA
ncbi:polysaccharide pyruvyl transferase family protein [Microbacterium marmarense]|uniref:Polysaccharide pyruvyl transferase family protein n=1 Tax=Microbacterium marmarense TaxID=3122051 RepID=A0ABU8LRK0_9MICO